MRNHRLPIAILAALSVAMIAAAGCTTDSSGTEFTLPGFTILAGSIVENSDGSISVPVDGDATLLLDAALSDSTVRLTVTGRFDGTHLYLELFGDELLDHAFEIFLLRTATDELFMNIIHPSQGAMMNTTLTGPYAVGDDFTIRAEVVNRVNLVRLRVWAPGDAFTDTPALDTDDLTPITPWTIGGGMRAGMELIGATIRSITVNPVL